MSEQYNPFRVEAAIRSNPRIAAEFLPVDMLQALVRYDEARRELKRQHMRQLTELEGKFREAATLTAKY